MTTDEDQPIAHVSAAEIEAHIREAHRLRAEAFARLFAFGGGGRESKAAEPRAPKRQDGRTSLPGRAATA